jgi:hypothetical protein
MKTLKKIGKSRRVYQGVRRLSSSSRRYPGKTTYNFPINIVTTLRFLLALNKELSSFEAPLNRLLARAVEMEKIFQNFSKLILKVATNRVLLENCKLKLGELLIRNEIEPQRKDAVHHAIFCILVMLFC